MKNLKIFVVLLFISILAVSANAALIDNEDGTITQIRNDGSKLMWLQDADTPYTSGYCSVPGNCNAPNAMYWTEAIDWIAYLNSTSYLGYNNWQLPETGPINETSYDYDFSYDGSTDFGFNISASGTVYEGNTGSDMAYMYYTELGNAASYDTSGNSIGCSPNCMSDQGLFTNLHLSAYWSSEYGADTDNAWMFGFGSGAQSYNIKTNAKYVTAVRFVPEPISSTLFIIGGAALGFRRVRKG